MNYVCYSMVSYRFVSFLSSASVLYDRPVERYKEISTQEKHEVNDKLSFIRVFRRKASVDTTGFNPEKFEDLKAPGSQHYLAISMICVSRKSIHR